MTNFPASLDTFLNPSAATTMDAAGFQHDVQHSNLNDAVAALQAKVGITGSADPTSLDSKVTALLVLLSSSDAFRCKNGQLQIYDTGYQQWVPLTSVNGVLGTGAPTA